MNCFDISDKYKLGLGDREKETKTRENRSKSKLCEEIHKLSRSHVMGVTESVLMAIV